MSTSTPTNSSRSSRVLNAAWLSSALWALCIVSVGCAGRPLTSGDTSVPPQIVEARQQAQAAGLEATGNFERTGESVALLCFAAPRLALPESYQQLRFQESRDGECDFDTTRWDVLSYRPEAVAGVNVAVTPELAAAPEARANFVVAHEEFHDQESMRRLPPGLHEPAATLAGFLIAPQQPAAPDTALLFRQKAVLINRYHHQAARLYRRYDRGELTESEALSQKQSLFESLQSGCAELTRTQVFNRCPAVLNNAGLAFDSTYTRLYPLMYELLPATGWDRQETLRLLAVELPEMPAVERAPRQALRDLVTLTLSAD